MGKINLSKSTFLILFLAVAGIGLTIGAVSADMVFNDKLLVDSLAGNSEVEITSGTGHSMLILTDQGLKEFQIFTEDGKKKLVVKDATKNKIRLALRDNGKFGIGIKFPQERLDVNGNIKLIGDIISDNPHC